MVAPLAVTYVRISLADIRRARSAGKPGSPEFEHALAEKLAMHQAECDGYARDEGYDVAERFGDNNRSASRLANKPLPGREDMFSWLREHEGPRITIITTEIERLARQVTHAVQIRDLIRPKLIVACTDGTRYDLAASPDEHAFMVAAAAGERESLKISERRRRRERARAADGHFWGTSDPFGYTRVFATDPASGQLYYTGQLAEHTVQAALVRQAARDLIDGRPLRSVVLAWKDAGVRSRTDKPLTQSQVRNILLNPRLAGVRVHRPGDNDGRADRTGPGQVTPGAWPAILDPDTAAALRVVLVDPARRTSTSTARAHLLAGLAECGKCGATMKGHSTPGHKRADGTQKRYRSYVCPDPAAGGNRCTRRDADALEQHVLDVVRGWLAPGAEYERAVSRRASVRDDSARLAAIDHEARKLELTRADLGRLLADPDQDRETLATAARTVRDRLHELADERAALAAVAERAITPARPLGADTWDAMTVAERADWLRQYVSRVIVRPTWRGGRVFRPEDVEVIPGPWWADALADAS